MEWIGFYISEISESSYLLITSSWHHSPVMVLSHPSVCVCGPGEIEIAFLNFILASARPMILEWAHIIVMIGWVVIFRL